jgi:hypothetical protein
MSTVNTMTLTEFLLARIAEDEAAAERGRSHNGGGTFANDNYGYLLVQPARVLAECAAKRQAIEAAWGDQVQIEGEWGHCQGREEMSVKDDNPAVVEHLAAVYADHPDYREEWRP